MTALLAVLVGLVVGSFLNVCISRLPRGESVVSPRSYCPLCHAFIRAYDNIPLLSFLLLRGRCRACGERISVQYPVVELLTALAFLAIVSVFGVSLLALFLVTFLCALVVITFIDLEHQIIPDLITVPGILLGLLGSLFLPRPPFLHSLVGLVLGGFRWWARWDFLEPFLHSLEGLLLGGGLFYLVAVLSKGGMGGGDIKLAAMIGAFLGWQKILVTIFVGTFSGSLVGLTLLLLKRKGRKDPIPFGPFLALGAVISLFFGEGVIAWYWRLLRP